MDKITVTQDDVEAAKDEGATFVLEELAEMVGVSDWSIQDGSESWEGDVSATAYHILVQANVINDWDNSVARHQNDAQMAAPDALAAELAALDAKATPGPWDVVEYNDAESLAIHDRPRNWRVCFMATPGSVGSMEAILASADLIVALRNNLPAIIASLSTSNAMRDALIRCGRAVGAHLDDEVSDEFLLLVPQEVEAKIAALAGQGTTLDRQTVERVLEPDDLLPSYCRLLDAMQGDDPDAVDSAFHASIEAVSKFGLLRASMGPTDV